MRNESKWKKIKTQQEHELVKNCVDMIEMEWNCGVGKLHSLTFANNCCRNIRRKQPFYQ